MKEYEDKKEQYEVFTADMTVDTKVGIGFSRDIFACQKCKCHCHLCRGGISSTEDGILKKIEKEQSFKKLLAA